VTQTPWWDEFCPTVYREIIEAKAWPDHCDKAALKAVALWGPSMQTGLCLHGPSGTGKTLALWAKARQLERTGSKPVMLSAVEFARKLSTAARDLTKAEWLMQCGVLIIDDLGKEKLTAAVAPLLWEVIDERNNRRRPTLISSRFSGSQFVARFTDEVLGEDIRGRIADCSTVVHFRGSPAHLNPHPKAV
jgi:DNA replication protein DnaC